MTLYAGTIVDTPGDPFAGDPGDALAEAASEPATHSKSAGTVAMAVPARYSSFSPLHAVFHCCPAALMAWRL